MTTEIKVGDMVVKKSSEPMLVAEVRQDVVYVDETELGYRKRFWASELQPLPPEPSEQSPTPRQIIEFEDKAILRKVLSDHWMAAMICDHEAETDKAICSCSRVNLPVKNSVGESAQTWVDHVMDEYKKALTTARKYLEETNG